MYFQFFWPCICLSDCTFILLSFHPPVCTNFCFSVLSPSIHQIVHLSVFPPFSLSFCPSVMITQVQSSCKSFTLLWRKHIGRTLASSFQGSGFKSSRLRRQWNTKRFVSAVPGYTSSTVIDTDIIFRHLLSLKSNLKRFHFLKNWKLSKVEGNFIICTKRRTDLTRNLLQLLSPIYTGKTAHKTALNNDNGCARLGCPWQCDTNRI